MDRQEGREGTGGGVGARGEGESDRNERKEREVISGRWGWGPMERKRKELFCLKMT